MKHLWFISLLFALIGCRQAGNSNAALMQVDACIETYPDSAMAVLQRISSTALRSKEERAQYALLLSMAMDKSYIDTTDFAVLQPAIDYYRTHGTATDKLRTHFYQGRIYQNAGNDSLAMACFVEALDQGAESDDTLTLARTYSAQGKLYRALYAWDKSIECHLHAATLFMAKNRINNYFNCLNYVINDYTLKDDSIQAHHYIEECKKYLSDVSQIRIAGFYPIYLVYLIHYSTNEEVRNVLNHYLNNVPQNQIDWLTVADAYTRIGEYKKADKAIQNVKSFSTALEGLSYYAIKANISKYLERQKEAVVMYENFFKEKEKFDLAIIAQDTKFIEERHQLEMKSLQEHEAKNRILLWTAILLITLLMLIIGIRQHFKIRVAKKEKDYALQEQALAEHKRVIAQQEVEKLLALQEAEKYKTLYTQMEEERDNLTDLLQENHQLDEMAKETISTRLELLNRFFTIYLTDCSQFNNKFFNEIKKLLEDKENFMNSTRLSYTASHPHFIQFFKEHHLTDEEINYCCLYALGLRGTDVGKYLNRAGHYNLSSQIREKLGITEHDTNLGNYIRILMEEHK